LAQVIAVFMLWEEHRPDYADRQTYGYTQFCENYRPEAAARVAHGHHEQARTSVTVAAGHACQRALTVVDLRLFAGGELKPVELFRLTLHQPAGEAFDAVVAAGEADLVDQVLLDGSVVPTQA
jgi:hypothetical protein